MNLLLPTILLVFHHHLRCQSLGLNSFPIAQLKANNTIILGEIIINYINKYFSEDKMFVSMISKSSKNDQTLFEEEFSDDLFSVLDQAKFAHTVIDRLDNATYDNRNAFNLILVDNSSILASIINETSVYEVHLTQCFLIAVANNVQNDSHTLESIFKLLWQNSLLNSHVLIQSQPHFWSMYTFMPYQRDCFTLDAVKIATFTPLNFTSNINASLDGLFPKKLANFRKCPLFIAPSLIKPYAYMQNTSDGKSQYKGIDISILEHVSKALNFDIVYKRASKSAGHGNIFPNGTLTENIALVFDGKVNLTTGGYGASVLLSTIFSLSIPYIQSSLGFAFRENEVDSPLTRLTAPFQIHIWLMINGLLLISIVIILLTKKFSRRWRHFVIGGRQNRTPILNMWNTVLGAPICNPRMANRQSFGTFARTLLLLWIMLWFIIRNSYQGALYDFLQRHQFSSAYDTLEKIIESDCKILVPPHTPRSFVDSKRYIYGGTEVMENLLNFYDNNINGVALATDVLQKAFNFENPHRRLGFTKDRLRMYSSVFVFHKKSMLTRPFNEQLQRLQEFGLPEFWKKNRIDEQKVKTKKTQPTKLGLDNILAAFQICGVLYVISFFVFVLEVMSVKFRRIKYVLDFLTY